MITSNIFLIRVCSVVSAVVEITTLGKSTLFVEVGNIITQHRIPNALFFAGS